MMAVNFFFTFSLFKSFFPYSHYKRKEQGPAELKKELTNTTKILQFARSAQLSQTFMIGQKEGWEGQAEWEGLGSKGPVSSMEQLTIFPSATNCE